MQKIIYYSSKLNGFFIIGCYKIDETIRGRMEKIKVLFICSHNSARSQMAETFLRQMGGDRFQVASAGITPGELNPLAVAVMQETGINISSQKPQATAELLRRGDTFDYVITVCDQAAQVCPVFPGPSQQLAWSFEDPATFTGTWEEKMEKTRKVRDLIREKIVFWLNSLAD